MKQIKEFFEKYGVLTHEELPNGIGGLTCFVIDGTDEPIDIRGTEDKLYYLITTKKIIPIIKLNKTLNEHEKEYVFRHELGHLVY
jgi:Zn-dependent peptidase ImmA (M78 family)